MKLLFVIKTLAPRGGGAERVLAQVTGAIASVGHDVTVASFDAPDAESFYPLDPKVKWLKLAQGDVARRSSPMDMVRRIRLLRRIARQVQPDVAIGFMHSSYVLLGWALARTGIPVVGSDHASFDYYRENATDRRMLRLAKPFLVSTTMISETVRQGYPAPLRRRTDVIANPVDIGRSEGPLIPARSGPRHTILSVGRLDPYKDQKTLIAAFARLAPKFPDWDLRIVGEGDLRPSLEQQVDATGLNSRISLPGGIADIGREYAAASLFVLPSLFESFGLATAEAMASGLPVIGFADCPGTNELITDGVNGLLAGGPDRVEALAAEMEGLMANADRRAALGAAGPAAVARYSIEAVRSEWLELLERVASRPS